MTTTQDTKATTQHLGIPRANFMADIGAVLKENGEDAEHTIVRLKELHSKYTLMEESLTIQREGLKQRIPTIRRNLDMVKYLHEQASTENEESADGGDMRTTFELAAGLWASAAVKKANNVLLTLGANVLMEYSTEEAMELLSGNLTDAEQHLATMNADLAFLKDQKTTTEVNMNRTFNWDVKQRRYAKAKEAAAAADLD